MHSESTTSFNQLNKALSMLHTDGLPAPSLQKISTQLTALINKYITKRKSNYTIQEVVIVACNDTENTLLRNKRPNPKPRKKLEYTLTVNIKYLYKSYHIAIVSSDTTNSQRCDITAASALQPSSS